MLNLVTYNILATIYATKETYPYTDKRYLTHHYRSALIKNDLQNIGHRLQPIPLVYPDVQTFASHSK